MVKRSLPKCAGVLVSSAAIAALVWVGGAEAVNNRPRPQAEKEKLGAVLATIQKEKSYARSLRSKALAKDSTQLEKDWGIKLNDIRCTAAGYMLEMTFRVLDPQKAFPLLKTDANRYVVVDKSGAVLEVPFTEKLGSLKSTVRSSNMVKEDHSYLTLFANPGKHVKPGDKIHLVMGNFMAENLIVH
jgi:hypothetical protein